MFSILQTVLNALRKEQLLSDNAFHHITKSYDGIPALMMASYIKLQKNAVYIDLKFCQDHLETFFSSVKFVFLEALDLIIKNNLIIN